MHNKLRYTSSNIAEIVIVILILAVVSWLGYKFFRRIDLTENKQYTISQATKDVLASLGDPVSAEFFLSSDLPPQFMSVRDDVRDRLDEYVAYGRGRFKLKVTDPGDDEEEKQRATQLGIQELEVQITERDALSVKKVFFGLVLAYEDKTETIRTDEMVDPSGLEYAVTSRLVKLTQVKKPKVGLFVGNFTTSQQQQGPTYDGLRQFLGGAEGLYEFVTLTAQGNRTLPEDLDGLIIAGAFGMADSMKYDIDQFLLKGGQVLVAIDPMMQPQQQAGQPQQAYPSLPTIEDQLARYGVSFNKQLVVDQQAAQAPMSGGMFTIVRQYLLWPRIGPNGFSQNVGAVSQLESMVMPWCCPLSEVQGEGIEFVSLAETTSEAFTIKSPFSLDPDQDWAFLQTESATSGPYTVACMLTGELPTAFPDGPPSPVDRPEPGEEPDPATLTPEFDPNAQLRKGTGQGRLVVLSSALAISDGFLRQFNENALFVANVMDMMLMGDELLGIRSTPVTARPLKQLSDAQMSFYRWVNVLGVSALLVLFGLLLWFLKSQRRRAIARHYGS